MSTSETITRTDLTNILNEVLPSSPEIVSFTKGTVTSSGKTFNLPNNYRGVLYIVDSTSSNCGEYFVFTSSGGVVSTKAVTAASNLTINTSTNNKITVTPPAGTRLLLFINIQGKATV